MDALHSTNNVYVNHVVRSVKTGSFSGDLGFHNITWPNDVMKRWDKSRAHENEDCENGERYKNTTSVRFIAFVRLQAGVVSAPRAPHVRLYGARAVR